jgi:hypothetical protein
MGLVLRNPGLKNGVSRTEITSYSGHKTVVSVSSWNRVMLLELLALRPDSFLCMYHLMDVLLNYC